MVRNSNKLDEKMGKVCILWFHNW